MPLPAAWNTKQIKGSRADFLGNAATGKITFTPTAARIKDTESDLIVFAKPVEVILGPDGTFLATLPVSVGDTDITPAFQYEVLEQLVGTPDFRYTIEIPMDLPNDTPFDIADLVPVGTVPTGTTALTRATADLYYALKADAVTTATLTAAIAAASTLDRDRANHTGTQASTTISDMTERVQDIVGSMFSGGNVTTTYNDTAGTIELTVSGAVNDAEATRDAIGAALIGVGVVTVTVNDALDTITISVDAASLRDRTTHTGTQPISSVTNLQTELDVRLVIIRWIAGFGWERARPSTATVPFVMWIGTSELTATKPADMADGDVVVFRSGWTPPA